MNRTTIWTLVLSMALASSASAAPTDEENCQKAKLTALGKLDLCLQKERGKEVTGKTSDTAACQDKFAMSLMKADEKAAKKGASCRWLENGDGTATDLNSGLQWELKDDAGGIHDVDDDYTWTVEGAGGSTPDGDMFTVFFATLNHGVSADGSATAGCFAGHCDWRLPTIEELRGLLIEPYPCGTDPCTTIPGATKTEFTLYQSATTVDGNPGFAWTVGFSDGFLYDGDKDTPKAVRAVRGD